MAYKVFSNGDALTGSELNTYLMNQSVMVFATATARDAALTTPSEGMLVWLQDSDKYVKYDGSAWVDLISAAGSGNAIINGAFEINQRNFTSVTTTAYGFDRWTLITDGVGATYTPQTFTPGTAPVSGYEAKNFAQVATTGQSSAGTYTILGQRIEDVRTFAGQTITVSFWAKAASGTPKVAVELNQYFSGGSADVSTPISAVTLSTSWARYSVSVAVPSLSGKTIGAGNGYLELNLWTSAGSSFATRASSIGIQTATIGVWGVQVESGSTATAFKRNASNIQGELAACQRYYYRQGGTHTYQILGYGGNGSTTLGNFAIQLPVTMRTAPTSVEYSTLALQEDFVGGVISVTNLTLASPTSTLGNVDVTVSSGLTKYRPVRILTNNSTSGYLGFSAEL